MKTVGEMLKSAREKKGLSLTDVQKFTKIHPKYLLALEENDYSQFSSLVHTKGFLKLYASVLDLNVDEVLAFFRREFDEKKVKKPRVIRPIESPGFLITPATVIVFSTLILILAFFAYLFYQYRSYTGAPSLVVESPSSDIAYSEESLEVVGRTDRDSSVFLNGQKININPDGTFVFRVDLSEGLNSLNFLSVNKLGKETRITRSVVVKKEGAAEVSLLKLELFAKSGSSPVLVFSDGRKEFEGTMLFGTSRVFEASSSIKLKAGNAGVLTVKFNGNDLGVFGKEGEEKEEEFKNF